MAKTERDFYDRPQEERSWLENETWCDGCRQADLGLIEPHEYEENGAVFIEGKCRACGGAVASKIM
jgi:hypothetical protein